MNRIYLGIICGLVFGILDVLIMIPLKYENNRKMIEAMSSAFIERFMLGLLIPNLSINISPVLIGLLLGTTLSMPVAIITRVYVPIMSIGIIGGIIIGLVVKFIG